MDVKLVSVTPRAEQQIVEIARVSSSRKDRSSKPEGLINYLIKHSHWSPFEHGHMTLFFETSKAIGIQLIRHRSFTFQEFSQRYQDVGLLDNMFEDVELRKHLAERKEDPAIVAIQPLNEAWKGNFTIVGINRAWYKKTNKFSGNRATDAYLCDLTKAANIEPILPNINTLHLQRGKDGFMGKIIDNGIERDVFGLPDDETSGGYSSKNPVPPKYYHIPSSATLPGMEGVDVIKGKKRFDEDLKKLTDG